MTRILTEGQPVRPRKHMCADCGGTYWNAPAHAESCPGPLSGAPYRPCGKTVLRFGGRTKDTCWLSSGHEGDCA